jgi:STAS-like domain of unknown function (DUF4325)/Histidine kinase-like ATPase domain
MSKDQVSPIPAAIERLLDASGYLTTGAVARLSGVSRQGAHYHLSRMVDRGELLHEGRGRGGRYRRAAYLTFHYNLVGLKEDEVWAQENSQLRIRDPEILDNPHIPPILNFAFTEMLNNAIDHSGGSVVDVRWYLNDRFVAFEIADDGVGAFRHMAETRGLENEYDAIGEISKGKQTTAPWAHSGLGIYFSSQMVDRFVLSSGHLSWIVDSRLDDVAVEWLEGALRGTLVRCEVDADTTKTQLDVFNAFAPPSSPGVNRSHVRVALFERGSNFVSRTEAKRLAAELESFGEVEVDFRGVGEVGQGFIDELFRVWQEAHPETRLVATNTNPAIDALMRITLSSP